MTLPGTRPDRVVTCFTVGKICYLAGADCTKAESIFPDMGYDPRIS